MPSYSLITFGCQMNQHDSERMEEVLRRAGYVPSEGVEQADVVLLNTCSVREKAEQKLRSEVGRLGVLKRRRPELMIGVAGCVAQQEGERLLRKMPQIDLLVGPDHIASLPAVLRELEGGAPPQVLAGFDVEAPRFLSAEPGALGRQAVSAFVTVMKGCDERCSFCIVPTTRGPERYRPAREIVAECTLLVQAGAREITLLGQTVDSYLDPERSLTPAPADAPLIAEARSRRGAGLSHDVSEFPALLRAIAEATPALARLRYTSPHPRHLTPQLICAHRELPVLARHVHMPVQSGSDAVLRRMIRRYSVAEYLERTGRLREAVPGLTLSTDVIVGFPGETDADFQATLDLVEQVGFVGVFGFKYSERPGTAALKFEDDVPEAVKSARLTALFERSERLQRAHLAALVGSVQAVLVEGPGKTGGYSGRTSRNEIVHLGASADVTGELCQVKIVSAYKHSLLGELVDAARRAPPPAPGERGAQGPGEPPRAELRGRVSLPVV
ncbi:MAG: tRNA (N6-isopentenyl adenosine(37)-C2)-methylthiotransferase MiaB [Polyangiaceae bacterium]|nr:tRNA (N6-isopentenyl adenosine(37)-C2)-methylthiotransferase MiaB [Polyangiaceae bacterium]MCW5791442.1 tRNA (N6-isopentenyl adenosine(37)-C2)-methylthiotransferase MiaB [Polyangiaceae bacterium]